MPEISRFFGIIVTMYFADHPPPHFHVRYGNRKGRFSIDEPRMLEGDLGPRAQRMVVEWAGQHLEDLRKDWELARSRKPLAPIAPLE